MPHVELSLLGLSRMIQMPVTFIYIFSVHLLYFSEELLIAVRFTSRFQSTRCFSQFGRIAMVRTSRSRKRGA